MRQSLVVFRETLICLTLSLIRALENVSAEERAQTKELIKTVSERSALLKLTAGAMVKAANEFVTVCKTDGKRWTR